MIVEQREEHAADDRADQEADADARERARDLLVVHVQLLHQVLQARPVHAERQPLKQFIAPERRRACLQSAVVAAFSRF